jgi:phosphoglycolate phosphatase-like HAD superfamily hydrolase
MNKEFQTLIFDRNGVLVDTEHDEFSQADLVASELGDTSNAQVTLSTLNKILVNN